MLDFFYQYFVDPIYSGEGYNTYNTVVYGLLLGVGLILVEKFVIKLKLEINEGFMWGVLPFLVLASFMRSLIDAQMLPRTAFFITPGIFLSVTVIAIGTLLVSRKLETINMPYYKIWSLFGLALLIFPSYILLTSLPMIKNPQPMATLIQIFILFFISFLISYNLIRLIPIASIQVGWIYGIFLGHMLDASATIIGVEYYGYFEEHVFEDWLINLVGTAYILFAAKIVALSLIIFIVHKVIEEEYRPFWYFAFFVLGFSPGLRDALTIMLVG